MATLAERFNAHVDRSGVHHVWLGACDKRGVPQFRVDGRLTTARRVAWELERGPLPDRARIRACANDPRCVLLDHLAIAETHASPLGRGTRRRRGDGSMREIRPGTWRLTVTVEPHRRI